MIRAVTCEPQTPDASAPICWIIAGPNGAGKSTFALEYLPTMAGCRDLIAAGLPPGREKGGSPAARNWLAAASPLSTPPPSRRRWWPPRMRTWSRPTPRAFFSINGYRYFYEDSYGKDYRIFNLPAELEQHRRNYLTAALVAFYQQQRLYADRKGQFRPYNLTSPLWVFVGASVVKDDSSKETKANYERASDVAQLLRFMAWFAAEREEAVDALNAVFTVTPKGPGW